MPRVDPSSYSIVDELQNQSENAGFLPQNKEVLTTLANMAS